MTIRFVLVLLIVKQILGGATISVALADYKINSITNYTWVISFSDSLPRTYMTFTFPTAVATSSNSASYYLGTQINATSIGANSITIPTTGLSITSSMTFIITNIVNPSSAITSVRTFQFSSSQQTNVALDLTGSINYLPGSLNTCTWTFNKCTEQANSLLTINVTTVNRIPSGNQLISVGFPAVWANHYNKSPVSGLSASSLVCSISFNGGTVVSSGVTCTFTSNTIRVSYNINAQINGSSLITIYISGVNTPPTINTQFSAQYTTKTADASGNTIDGIATGSGCTINPICVTNYSIATLAPTSLPINSQTTNLKTTFNFFPTITFISSDAVQIFYTQPSSLVSCGTFRVLRNTSVYDLVSNSTGSLMSYYFSSTTTLPNTEYSYNISVYFLCSSILLPKSEEPTTFVYKFKRNGDEYLELTATLTATAIPLNSTNASLVLTNNQMGATATTYTFSFSNGQGLSSSPLIVLQFPSDILLTGVTCMMGANGAATSTPCSSLSTSLMINYTGASGIASGSNITIKVIGITNPLSPTTRTFGITTYYNATVNTSRVQYNNAAFNANYSAITNIGITLAPSTYTVYTLTPANISFISPLVIPPLSTFSLIFPSEVSQISSTSQGLMINNSYALLNATPITTGSTLTFYNYQEIPLGSSLTIILTLRSPTHVNTFSYVQLVISKDASTYIQSLSTMVIQVTSTGVMPVSISPLTSLTGATSSYEITLTLTIPHPSPFILIVNVGSDTTFNGVGATCTSATLCSSLTANGNSSISLSINNPSPNSTTPINIIVTINSFTTPRSVGIGALWNISTKTSALDPISFQSASPIISVPNLLTGALEAGDYYRNNTNTVKLKINFTNLLLSTDYLLFSMDKTTYNVNTNVSCSSMYGSCSVYNATTNNVLVLKVIPNSSNLFANPLSLWIEGLISGGNTMYLQTEHIVVGSYNSNGQMIDQGTIEYSISCGDALSLPNSCRTCSSSGTCLTCYVSQGYYLNGTTCVTSCGGATSFMFYGNSTTGTCQSCTTATNGCLTCSNQTACMSCLNSSYYLYTTTLNCSLFCSNTSGYKDTYISGIRVCVPCADPNCLVCTATSYGTCTQCSSTSILVSGICSNNCPSLSYYVLNANCVACDQACYTCTAAGNRSCIACEAGYYNSSGVCTTTCPTGTAKIISNGTCGCYSACLTCDSNNYANCTVCLNSSLLLYNGQCVTSCPTSTYLLSSSCVACSSGCVNCTQAVCFTCAAGLYMFSSKCYGDCNAISSQYDVSNSTCILCPTGCDTCSNGACSSCLADYSLLSATCVKACLLTNSCQIDASNVLPLPGAISVLIWCIVVLIIRYFSHSNYVPYSMILLSSLVQFCLVLAILSQASSAVVISRLLTMDTMSKNIILILLGFTLALNYITNIIYLYIFVKYLKPLVTNPKQIDVITNAVTLAIAVLTNYRFAIVAFSKMFPKPRIHIQMARNLTPVHYICFVSLILSIFPMVVCAMLLGKQQKLTNLYMLALDLMIIIIFNAIITIWFISSKKDEAYFDDQLKKQYVSEDINITKENIKEKQEKDHSNVNMIASIRNSQKDGNQSDQYDFGESYKQLKAKKTQIKANNLKSNNSNTNDPILIDDLPEKSIIQKLGQNRPKKSQERNIFAIENEYEAELEQPHKVDVNYEDIILSRRSKMNLGDNSKMLPNKDINNKLSRATTMNRNYGPRQQRMNQSREMDLDSQKFDKQFHPMHKNEQGLKQISDIENGSYNDMEDSLNKLDQQAQQINFQPKQKLPRPRRLHNNTSMQKKPPSEDTSNNKTAMRKIPNKRYFQSDATFDEKQKDAYDDLSAIIKNKVHESSIRKSQNVSILTHEEHDLEQISPSYYNFQNQRFHLEDVQASSNQS